MDRYKDIKTNLDSIRKKTLVTTELPVIERSIQDRFVYTNSEDRLDNLAYEFYGDPRQWVILALANNLGKGTLACPPGIQLRIPPQAVVTNFADSMRKAQGDK